MSFLTASIPIGKNRSVRLPILLWFSLAIAAASAEILRHSINNYYIFKGVFWHTLARTNLYVPYPAEHFDTNHYGPFFSFVIAPFAVLPDWLGVFAWCMVNSFVLFYAINKLPFKTNSRLAILLIAAIEMMTSIHNVQINAMLAGWMILAFVLTENRKDFWAALFIAAGFMTKLYGIAGLLFFVFSKDKLKFSLSFVFWVAVMFFLPMLFSSPHFILSSYSDWFGALLQKNTLNISGAGDSIMQDISCMGFLRRSFGVPASLTPLILIIASFLILVPLLRFNQISAVPFRLYYLAVALISVVIFSSSAESPTYVIAVSGVAIWYMSTEKSRWTTIVLVMTLVITCLAGTDLFPAYIRDHFISPYSLKALPCVIVWLILIASVSFKNFVQATESMPAHETRKHYIAGLQ